MQKITDLNELLKHELKDLYSAEVQILDALPKMVEKATHPELKKAFSEHLKVTEQHRKRLDDVQAFFNLERVKETKGFFANLFKSKEGEEHCKAMEGLIKEAKSLMGEDMAPEVMDAALIAAAQKIEHYEISSYGTARAYATQLGYKRVYDILTQTLNEEYAADDSLTSLAVGKVNISAEEDVQQTPVAAKTNKSAKEKTPAGKNKPDKVAENEEADTDTDKAMAVPVSKKAPSSSKSSKISVQYAEPDSKVKSTAGAKKVTAKKAAGKKTLAKKVAKAEPPKKAARKTTTKRTAKK